MGYIDTDIRPMKENDIPSVFEIEKLCFPTSYWKESDLLYELKENPVSNVWVIELSNAQLGLKSICGYVDYWNTYESATISRIAVHPDIQRQHLASELMKEVIDDCKAKKTVTITLEVRESNIAAINLYKKFGFVVSHIKPHYYKDGENALYMILEVNKHE